MRAKEGFRPRSIETGLGPGSSVHATPVLSRKLYVSINALSLFDEPKLYVICEMNRRSVLSCRDSTTRGRWLTHGTLLQLACK